MVSHTSPLPSVCAVLSSLGRPEDKTPPRVALFLDFDGTLVDIAETPTQVVMAAETHRTLSRLHRLLDGAVAIVSGRDIESIDAHLEPLIIPVAGSHGLQRRDAGGAMHRITDAERAAIAKVREPLAARADPDGLLLEDKPGALALHFRSHPSLEPELRQLVDALVAAEPGLRAIHGHKVAEIALARGNKGTAVTSFMNEAPFCGRLPFMAGDDATDEDAFAAVAEHGGAAIKIGEGETLARYRVETNAALLAWLKALADIFDEKGA